MGKSSQPVSGSTSDPTKNELSIDDNPDGDVKKACAIVIAKDSVSDLALAAPTCLSLQMDGTWK